ncbi:MAG: nucleotidyltransferase family protein [Burkholderiaceae bacterium]
MITTGLILAAGRGARMRPLTDHTPKPLLAVRGQPLLARIATQMQAGGMTDLVVNTAWLEAQIADFLSNLPLSLRIQCSMEGRDFGHALETAGGIVRALPQMPAGTTAFWLSAGDVYAPAFQFDQATAAAFLASDALAHLWLVPNPAHNPNGDFALDATGRLRHDRAASGEWLTYATIGLFKTKLFGHPWCDLPPGNPTGVSAPLAPLLRRAMDDGLVTGTRFDGEWVDVGTPQRLADLNNPQP